MISVVGLGPGNSDYITDIAKKSLEKADIIYGYKRQIDIIKEINIKAAVKEYLKLDELSAEIESQIKSKDNMNIAVLASGDPSLYGIAKYMNRKFKNENELRIIPGISSLQYLFAKTSIPMNDLYITSSHGKSPDIDLIRSMKKTAMMTDKEKGPAYIADIFKDTPDDPYIIIGEMLGYDDECITIEKASNLDRKKDYKMSVVIIMKGELYE